MHAPQVRTITALSLNTGVDAGTAPQFAIQLDRPLTCALALSCLGTGIVPCVAFVLRCRWLHGVLRTFRACCLLMSPHLPRQRFALVEKWVHGLPAFSRSLCLHVQVPALRRDAVPSRGGPLVAPHRPARRADVRGSLSRASFCIAAEPVAVLATPCLMAACAAAARTRLCVCASRRPRSLGASLHRAQLHLLACVLCRSNDDFGGHVMVQGGNVRSSFCDVVVVVVDVLARSRCLPSRDSAMRSTACFLLLPVALMMPARASMVPCPRCSMRFGPIAHRVRSVLRRARAASAAFRE